MRTIIRVVLKENWTLRLEFDTGEKGVFDVKPLLDCEAFEEADLSADTLYLKSKEVAMTES